LTPLLSTGLYPDGNFPARAWQVEALQVIDNKILMLGAAAPKAGKTILSANPGRSWAISLAENRRLSLPTNTPP
jgi:hypothetical protein